jgi:hypothetical protein
MVQDDLNSKTILASDSMIDYSLSLNIDNM